VSVSPFTKFGSGQRSYGADAAKYAPGPFGMLGMLKLKKAKTEMGVTLRLIDTSTAEIVVSVKGDVVSKKGGGLTVGGFDKVAGGADFSMSSDDYKASAIGEAQEKACQQVVQAQSRPCSQKCRRSSNGQPLKDRELYL
jgi:curli biogenesis system outer membrane secretion channel CsgG